MPSGAIGTPVCCMAIPALLSGLAGVVIAVVLLVVLVGVVVLVVVVLLTGGNGIHFDVIVIVLK